MFADPARPGELRWAFRADDGLEWVPVPGLY
jgi:hypothetical protein